MEWEAVRELPTCCHSDDSALADEEESQFYECNEGFENWDSSPR